MKSIAEILEASKVKDSKTNDIFLDPNLLGYSVNGQLIAGDQSFGFTEWGKSQMCLKLGVPYAYMEKCPLDLQAENINHWLKRNKQDWFVRTIDGKVRSVLTDKYSTFDNTEIIEMVDNASAGHKTEIKHFNQDDGFDGFHMRMTFPETSLEIGKLRDGSPDLLSFGLHIANSEVGKRSISITPIIFRLVCSNGLIVVADQGERFYQRHIGVKHEEMPLRVAQAFEKAITQGNAQMMKFAATKGITVADPLKAIDDIVRKIKGIYLPKDFSETLKSAFQVERLESSRATVYDLVNAFTRAAQSLKDDDRVAVESFIYRELVAA